MPDNTCPIATGPEIVAVTVSVVPEIVPTKVPLGTNEETVVPAVTPVPVTRTPGTIVPVDEVVIFITVPEIEPVPKPFEQAVEW